MVTGYAGSAVLSQVMSRPVICPLNVGAAAPDSLFILQRRLEAAEEQSEELVRSLASLGVSAEQLLTNSSGGKQPVSPVNICRALGAGREGLLWRQCETLVSCVCRLESLLQTLRLTIHRLETDRERNSSHTARLQEQLNTLQAQYEEKQRSSRRKVLHLQDQLQQAFEKKEEVQQEVLRLKEVLESTISSKVERDCVYKQFKEKNLRLDSARRNMETELQSTISEKLTLQTQLEVLEADLAKLQQSSTVAQETAVNHQQMLEQTIQKLQGDLSCTMRAEETMRKERDQMKSEMSSEISLLEKKKNLLETQLSEIKVELTTVNSGLQKQEKENRELMKSLTLMEHQQETHRQVEQMLWDLTDRKSKLAYEKGKLQAQVQQMEDDLKTLKAECSQHCQINMTLQNSYTQAQRENQMLKEHLFTLQQQSRDTSEVVQVLENVLSSHTLLQQNTHTLQAELRDRAQELHTLRTEKLQSMKEIQELKAEVENLHMLTHTQSNKVESLQKVLGEAQLDNRKQSLEQVLQEKQEKFNTLSQREIKLKEARAEIRGLTEHADSSKNMFKREKNSVRTSAHQLKKALDDASAKSCDLSQASQQLREKVSELEKMVCCQKSHLDTRTAHNSSLKIKDLEAEIEGLEEVKNEYKRKSHEQCQSLQQLQSEVAALQSELLCLASTQQGELQAERDLNHTLQEKCQHLEERLKRLQDERDEAEVRHGKTTQSTDEEHRDLCSTSESFSDESEPQKLRENLQRTGRDCTPSSAAQSRRKTNIYSSDPDLKPWSSTQQHWEITKELAPVANSYKPTRRVRTLT